MPAYVYHLTTGPRKIGKGSLQMLVHRVSRDRAIGAFQFQARARVRAHVHMYKLYVCVKSKQHNWHDSAGQLIVQIDEPKDYCPSGLHLIHN